MGLQIDPNVGLQINPSEGGSRINPKLGVPDQSQRGSHIYPSVGVPGLEMGHGKSPGHLLHVLNQNQSFPVKWHFLALHHLATRDPASTLSQIHQHSPNVPLEKGFKCSRGTERVLDAAHGGNLWEGEADFGVLFTQRKKKKGDGASLNRELGE